MERDLSIEELAELAVLEKKLEWLKYGVEVTECEIQLVKGRPSMEAMEKSKQAGRLL